jgi:hypothetical protein
MAGLSTDWLWLWLWLALLSRVKGWKQTKAVRVPKR